ncbi:MAG: hypothetical protein NZ739_08430 [Verrucomicrobiae bacterium]|nr:hypothetical protein [Verrucomicrobiae bacterium]MDW7979718.1 hypothetical protein [Verrucomicrobiales bacterium]
MLGSLIVGAAEGFGGKFIRTVSFLGCTLPVSFFGGTAPGGTLGMFSAIPAQTIAFVCGVSNLYLPGASRGISENRLREI